MNDHSHSIKRAGHLRIAGIVVLVLGIGGAALLYWIRTRGPDYSDDLSMLGFDRAQRRQMEMLYGKSGALIHEWVENMKQPGTQAVCIITISILIAVGCFYFAKLLKEDSEQSNS